ncbi:hypothetical protein PISL3812_05522 [Talaromyces islandicus]|uniref:FAD dependent oxidoreductase domain-containing protein n=1 Tax=Talaromyces islandicus TaxID=28573 RepID=A0A0U1M0H5_TALIS|nr:hypothetical protein PISL3812_05522 [Talaromyces islandicus]
MAPSMSVVVLGAGVLGLTTAVELLHQHPTASITVVAKHLPGDQSSGYCSSWAGANWISYDDKLGPQTDYEHVAFRRFLTIATNFAGQAGVKRFPLRLIYDEDDIKKYGTKKIRQKWYEDLVGGVIEVKKEELPAWAIFGLDLTTFMINPSIYLAWLQSDLLKAGVMFLRRPYEHIDQVFDDFPAAVAVFNCTGLGARTLGGVEDKNVYSIKGQTLLLAEPSMPLSRMYMHKINNDEFTHIFPRPLGGGIIVGGIRLHHDYNDEPDMDLAERIKRRACELCPELGKPENLKVIRHNVGFRPSREGGARIEKERRHNKWLIHNYGAGGTGYQASWGMAQHAVDLFTKDVATRANL